MKLPSKKNAKFLRDYFFAQGYDETTLRERLGTSSPLITGPAASAKLAFETRALAPFDLLVRCFLLGQRVAEATATQRLGSEITRICIETDFVQVQDGDLVPNLLLSPYDDLLLASDLMSSGHREQVLAVNPTSRYLSLFTVRAPVRRTLDLCGGAGIQGLAAARHSESVTITDISERCVAYAELNARLNGIENVLFRTGSAFEPVDGEAFDLIVCNPPFILTPRSDFVCYENPLHLDDFCRMLVHRAPEHLYDGGVFQMICEWVELKDQSWRERLSGWFADTGCDAWAIRANRHQPSTYVQMRIAEMQGFAVTGSIPTYDEWMAYYTKHEVRAIHSGLILMRKSASPGSGRPWVHFEELVEGFEEPVGEAVQGAVGRFDVLREAEADETLLDARLMLAPDVQFLRQAESREGSWCVTAAELRTVRGLPVSQPLDSGIAEFLVRFDGKTPLWRHVEALQESVGAPMQEVRSVCLQTVRLMLSRGFLIPSRL